MFIESVQKLIQNHKNELVRETGLQKGRGRKN
jgi:hypothetical protein